MYMNSDSQSLEADMKNLPTLMTFDEAADFLRVSARSIQRMADRGEIKPCRVGRRKLIAKAEVFRFLATQ